MVDYLVEIFCRQDLESFDGTGDMTWFGMGETNDKNSLTGHIYSASNTICKWSKSSQICLFLVLVR